MAEFQHSSGSVVPRSPNKQQSPADQDPRNPNQRRGRHGVTGLRLNLYRAKIDGSLMRRVCEAAIRKGGKSGKNQNYGGDFHRASGYTSICTTEMAGFGRAALDVEPEKVRNRALGIKRRRMRLGLLIYVPR